MQLADYPESIASLETRLNYQNRQIRTLQAAVAEIEFEADKTIAFDASLKNEAQRNVRRVELLAVGSHSRFALDLQTAIDRRSDVQTELDKLRNLFAVAKLDRRHDTALLEAYAA